MALRSVGYSGLCPYVYTHTSDPLELCACLYPHLWGISLAGDATPYGPTSRPPCLHLSLPASVPIAVRRHHLAAVSVLAAYYWGGYRWLGLWGPVPVLGAGSVVVEVVMPLGWHKSVPLHAGEALSLEHLSRRR